MDKKMEIFEKIQKIENLRCQKFDFQFFTKLQDSVSLWVLKLWQWSNNEKASIFIEKYDFDIFIGAREL